MVSECDYKEGISELLPHEPVGAFSPRAWLDLVQSLPETYSVRDVAPSGKEIPPALPIAVPHAPYIEEKVREVIHWVYAEIPALEH